ncbi:MAG: cupin [Acidocella sp. 20-63-7]|nr:MAG: cupin [Acidocella sp. 20-63-7]HQT45806.1 cupin domain-containing protein [Acidocella sp.]
MQLNADFSQRAVVHAAGIPWVESPVPGVARRMLDRVGKEVARATTVVRYAPASQFSAHTHDGGEEFFVLEGVFSDEYGDFPAGTYVRNPPTSHHRPGSAAGCTILVKLWQFAADDRTQLRVDTNKKPFLPAPERPGVEVMPLFEDQRETVRLERWAGGAQVTLAAPGGIEIFVLEGAFTEGGEVFEQSSWLRLPMGATLSAHAGGQGALLWIKLGHLAHLMSPPAEQSL